MAPETVDDAGIERFETAMLEQSLVRHAERAIQRAQRGDKAFASLALAERIEAKKAKARCAIHVIDLRTCDTVHWVRFDSPLREFYDVAVLSGCERLMAIVFQTNEIRRVITIGGAQGDALQLLAPQ